MTYPKLAALSASLPDPIGPQDCTDENRQAVECWRELMRRDEGGAQPLADELDNLDLECIHSHADLMRISDVLVRAAHALRAQGWRPIAEAPKGKKVLAGYWNVLGKWRTVTACYYIAGSLESEHEESGFAAEGWYEESETHEELLPCDCEPAYYMPLPAPPNERAK